jgi:hypothetical protein
MMWQLGYRADWNIYHYQETLPPKVRSGVRSQKSEVRGQKSEKKPPLC